MFEDSGTKVKDIASLMFGINAIASAILGIIIITVNVLLGLIVIVIGVLSAYICTLFLTAFGDLVQRNNELKEINSKILSQLEIITATTDSEVTKEEHTISIAQTQIKHTQVEQMQAYNNTQRSKVNITSDMLDCPNCGTTQRSTRIRCYKCGVFFEKD